MNFYTGIGSRNIPQEVSKEMETIAKILNRVGYTLRSGAADGADTSFENGVMNDNKEIYLPWKYFNKNTSELFNITDDAMILASGLHKGWNYLKPGAKKLMARNCYQVLGYDLRTPSKFVICWTPDGCETEKNRKQKTGGSGQAIALADRWNIPIYNIYNNKSKKQLILMLKEMTYGT